MIKNSFSILTAEMTFLSLDCSGSRPDRITARNRDGLLPLDSRYSGSHRQQ